jgi:hypothetical protein
MDVLGDLVQRGVLQPSTLNELVKHQMKMDRSDKRLEWAGLGAAWSIALAFLVVSAYVILQGHGVEGTVLGTVDLVALVTVFIKGRRA